MGRFSRQPREEEDEYRQRIEAGVAELCRETAWATGVPAKDVAFDYASLRRGEDESTSEWEGRVEAAAEAEQAKFDALATELERRDKAVDDAHDRAKASAGRIANQVAHTDRGGTEDLFKQEMKDLLLLYEETLQVALSKLPDDCQDRPDLPIQERNHRRQMRLLFHRGVMDTARQRMDPYVMRYLTNDSIIFRTGGYLRQLRGEGDQTYIDRVAAAVNKAAHEILAGYHHHRRNELLAHRGDVQAVLGGGDAPAQGLLPPRPFTSNALPSNVVGEVRSPGREASRSGPGMGLNAMLLSRHEELVKRGKVTSVQSFLKGGDHPAPHHADPRVAAQSPVDDRGPGEVDFIDGALVKGGVEVSQGNRLNYWIGVAKNLIRQPSRSPTESERADMEHFEDAMGVPLSQRRAARPDPHRNPLIVPDLDKAGGGPTLGGERAGGSGTVTGMVGNLPADVGGAAKCHPVQMNVLTAAAEGFLAKHWDLPVADECTPKELVEEYAAKYPEALVPVTMAGNSARGVQAQVDQMMERAARQFAQFLETKIEVVPACDEDVTEVTIGKLSREAVVAVPWEATGEGAGPEAPPGGTGSPPRHHSPLFKERNPQLAKSVAKKHLAYLDPNLVAIPHTLKRTMSLQELAAQRDVSPSRPEDIPHHAYLNGSGAPADREPRYYDTDEPDDVWSPSTRQGRPPRVEDSYSTRMRLHTPVMDAPPPPHFDTGAPMPLQPSPYAPGEDGDASRGMLRPLGSSLSPSWGHGTPTRAPLPPTAPAYLHPTQRRRKSPLPPRGSETGGPTTPHPSPMRLYPSPGRDRPPSPPKQVRFHPDDSPQVHMSRHRGVHDAGPVGAYVERDTRVVPPPPHHTDGPWGTTPLPPAQMNLPRDTALGRILGSASNVVPHLHLLYTVQVAPRPPPVERKKPGALAPRLRCDICRHDAVYMCLQCNGGAFCPHCWGQHHYGPNADPSLATHRKITTPYLCTVCSAKATLECRDCQVKCCAQCWDKVHEGHAKDHEPWSLVPHNYVGIAEPKQCSPARAGAGGGDVTKMWSSRHPHAVKRIEHKYAGDRGEAVVARPQAPPTLQAGSVKGGYIPSALHVKRLLGIYKSHAPHLIPSMMGTLRTHQGRETQLFKELEDKYSIAPREGFPDDPPAVAGIRSPLNRGATYDPPPAGQIHAPPRGSNGLRI